jgi:hypothetical protein
MTVMDRFFIGLVAAAGAAFAALGPAGTDLTAAAISSKDAADSVRLAWRKNASVPGCRVEMRWQHDYSGQPYLNKVRICA